MIKKAQVPRKGTPATALVAVVVAVALGVGFAFWRWNQRAPDLSRRSSSTVAPHAAEIVAQGGAVSPEVVVAPASSPRAPMLQAASVSSGSAGADGFPDEAALTQRLRQLGQSEPERTLELAREGNERFPEGRDAAERNWYLARALANLKLFSAAQDHARMMVERYPGTHWADDLDRHLLSHPFGLPTREEQERQADSDQ